MHCWCLLIQMCPLDVFRWADYKDCFVLSNFLLCVYLCTCVCVCVCHSVLMETEDNCLELVLFYCVRWGDWTEVLNLGSKYLYPLSQLTVSHHAWLLIIVCMCVSVGVNMTWHMSGGEDNCQESVISVQRGFCGLNLGPQACVASGFTCWAILTTPLFYDFIWDLACLEFVFHLSQPAKCWHYRQVPPC